MSFKTASAILRGRWFIQKEWADRNMALVVKMINGENVDFGMKRDESVLATVLSHKAGAIYQVGYFTDLSKIPEGSVAMLSIMGPITKFGDMCSYGSVDHTATLNRLAIAPNISGIILNIDSPGGEAAGTAMLGDAIKAATAHKPVIGLVDDAIAASAGYWILSPCTEIYVTKNTDMVGSIGVYTTIADWYGYFAEQGLNVRDVYAPESADKNEWYKQALAGNDELLQNELSVLAQEFIKTVSANRQGKLKSDEWNTGKMFYTKDAIKIGLIDGQKTVNEVYKRMDQLIQKNKSQSTPNNTVMSYPKTRAAAKAEGFQALVPGVATEVEIPGVFIPEEAIINIENSFVVAENNAAQVATLTAELSEMTNSLGAANLTIETLGAEIIALNQSDGTQQAAPGAVEADEFAKKSNSLNDPKSSLNQAALQVGL